MNKYYDEIARGYDELHKEEQEKKLRIISSLLSLNNKTKLLDVGCGSGISTRFFDCIRTGIDPSSKLLEIAQKKDSIGTYILGTAEKLPFDDATFGLVISVTAVGNFFDVKKGLCEMQRVSKGTIIISVLRRSSKLNAIRETILDIFFIEAVIEEEMDVIFFLREKILNS